MTMMMSKIADQHLSRQACIYIRQSTLAQVRFNQESTERQYSLTNKARSLGWRPEQIRILDRDLGQSGAAASTRMDFKTLVGDVAMGHVGAIFLWRRRGWRDQTRTGTACSSYAPLPARS
jgi:DNA invertase Pin-like site-specific DNA recombinase